MVVSERAVQPRVERSQTRNDLLSVFSRQRSKEVLAFGREQHLATGGWRLAGAQDCLSEPLGQAILAILYPLSSIL